MKKRILTILLVLVMCIGMLPAVSFAAGSMDVKITASKENPSVGDTVTFTVSVGAVTDLTTMDFVIDVPAGLTYVENSAKLADGLQKKLNVAAADWTEAIQKFSMYGDQGYTSTTDTVIMTFDCLVGDTASGTLSVSVKQFSAGDLDYTAISETIIPAKITIATPVIEPTGITLNKYTLDLKSGESETLTAKVLPEGAEDTVTWSSSNDKVATVDKTGKVTAVAKGTATITAKVGTFQATCTVTVACSHNRAGDTKPEEPATCTEPGHKAYFYCDECKTYFKDEAKTEAYGENEWVLPALGHNVTLTPAKAATCTATGNSAYYTCGRCGKFFSDEAATKEITENSWVLSTIDHDYKWVVDTEATEEATGFKHEECTVCHAKRSEDTVIPKLDHTHNMQHHAAVSATCTADGTVEYWHCTKCGKDFADKAGATELTTTVDPAKGHSYEGHDKKAATCVATGVEKHYTCKNCNLVFNSAMAVTTMNALTIAKDPANHVGERGLRNVRPATCTKKGYTGDTYCKSCDATIIAGTEIGTTPHTQKDGFESDGVQHWRVCKDCNTVIGEKVAHVAKEVWQSDSVNHWQVCKDCDAVITATKEAHIETSIWNTDNTNHWHVCSWCGGVIGSKAAHEFKWVIDQEATISAAGRKHEECETCGIKRNLNTEIPVLPDPDVLVKVPVSITVKKTGEADPGKGIFKLALVDTPMAEMFNDLVKKDIVKIKNDIIKTNGVGTFTGDFTFTVKESELVKITDARLGLSMMKGSDEGWTYDSDIAYYVNFIVTDKQAGVGIISIMGEGDELIPLDSNQMAFTNSYNAKAPVVKPPVTPGNTDSTPTTGDSGVTVWLIVLPVVALAAAGVVIAKKKREDQ